MMQYQSSCKTVKTEELIYIYLTDEEIDVHRPLMIEQGWVDEQWNGITIHSLDEKGIEYTTITYVRITEEKNVF